MKSILTGSRTVRFPVRDFLKTSETTICTKTGKPYKETKPLINPGVPHFSESIKVGQN